MHASTVLSSKVIAVELPSLTAVRPSKASTHAVSCGHAPRTRALICPSVNGVVSCSGYRYSQL